MAAYPCSFRTPRVYRCFIAQLVITVVISSFMGDWLLPVSLFLIAALPLAMIYQAWITR